MDSASDTALTGTDGVTCHQFIQAVRRHAIEAGKQRDDQWMSDYASINFQGDALVWYESLDDETPRQNDWKLLRRAILSRYAKPASDSSTSLPLDNKVPGFVFTGNDREERRSFVKYIRSRASAEGKENDSAWMVNLAYPCFSGKALDWNASLSTDIQRDWQRLERSILLDYPARSSLSIISPARIHIEDWYCQVRPSTSLQSIQSREDWLAQARERRMRYLEANDKSIPCWLLIETESEIPENALLTGPLAHGNPNYSARAWRDNFGLVVGKCDRYIPGIHLPLQGKEIGWIKPFEVLVGDPSYFQWIAIPLKVAGGRSIVHAPFEAVEAGIDGRGGCRATFIFQGFYDKGWHPGKVHSGDSVGFLSWGGQEIQQNAVRVLAWAD